MLSHGHDASPFPSTSQSRWATNSNTSVASHFDRNTAFGHSQHLTTSRLSGSGSYDNIENMGLSDPALRQIDEVANSMDLDSEYEVHGYTTAGSRTGAISIVLDTNVLLGNLEVMQQFAEDVERSGEPISIVIPGVVVQELDYQKGDRSRNLGWPARMASTWILTKLKERKVVKGQAYQETLQTSGNWKKRDPATSNDDLIVDCSLYLQNTKGHNVLLISGDHNLCNLAEPQGIRTLNPKDYHKWSSRMLARTMFGDAYPMAKLRIFSDFKETYRHKRVRQALHDELGLQPEVTTVIDDDGMEVDDGFVFNVEPPPQHLLDDLHDQILAHFTILLSELLRRVAPSLFMRRPAMPGASASIHASSTASRSASEWPAREILRYLCDVRQFPSTASRADKEVVLQNCPRLVNFFTAKYDKQGLGRSGQHWSRADWTSCLDALRTMGRIYSDEAIENSLSQLDPQLPLVFETPMRPTGIGGF